MTDDSPNNNRSSSLGMRSLAADNVAALPWLSAREDSGIVRDKRFESGFHTLPYSQGFHDFDPSQTAFNMSPTIYPNPVREADYSHQARRLYASEEWGCYTDKQQGSYNPTLTQPDIPGHVQDDYWRNQMYQNFDQAVSPQVANDFLFPDATMSSKMSKSPLYSSQTQESPASSITFDSLKCQDDPRSSNAISETNLYSEYFDQNANHIPWPSLDFSDGIAPSQQKDPFEALISIPSEQLSSAEITPKAQLASPYSQTEHTESSDPPKVIDRKRKTKERLRSLYDRVGEPESCDQPIECGCCGKTVNGYIELARHMDEEKHLRENYCPDEDCTFSIIGFNRRIALRRHICNHHLKDYNARRKMDQHYCSLHDNKEDVSNKIKEFLDLVYICLYYVIRGVSISQDHRML
ncbi:hypothetical protein CA3LBN_000533 [Candidozyma haemuli]|uniref:C2H2-type domain-containing protein n=1 Tax=Candidozyma haemuli TaxID=45357 RepID=A0ABX8I365_9ASCO|nr:hypothetical protein CA3LBN_000533 [[Candida] haemuloni]